MNWKYAFMPQNTTNYLILIFGFALFGISLSCKEKALGNISASRLSKDALIAVIEEGSGEGKESIHSVSMAFQIPFFDWKYDLTSADYSCNMPSSLVEISALGFIDDETMIAVNDEKADLYFLDKNTCNVRDKVDFGKNGDYEGVEYVDGVVYILKSNGNIYPFDIKAKQSLEPIKSALKMVNDVEGLGYDAATNMLLLACKGSPDLSDYSKNKDRKSVYGLDLEKKILIEDPLLIIKDSELFDFYERYLTEENQSKKSKNKALSRLKSFSPSGIAKHPIDNSYYILSSVGKLLVVCTVQGAIQHIEFLDASMCVQPEGIAFTTDGAMYISNEGKSFIGKIQGFDYKK